MVQLAGTAALTEAELRRSFEEAQRQADTVFAQYQLSQLLALGGDLALMAGSIIGELVRASDAVAGGVWLAASGEGGLRLVASEPLSGEIPGPVIPADFPSAGAAEAWARDKGWHGVSLDERRDLGEGELGARVVGFLALRPEDGAQLPADRVRLLGLVRHELAIAFRAAQLREELAGEQALLAAILDSTTEGILAVDEQRRVVRVNLAAVALLGGRVPPPGASCEVVLRCADPGGLRCGERCRFEEALVDRSAPVEAELRMTLKDGTEIPVAASFSAMAGHEKGAVVVLRDLRAERAAEELRASFLAAVSHELRTPLALISGHVDSLLDLGLDPAAERRSVERIGLAAARLQALVDELLDLTQAEHASLALHRARVGVRKLLESVVGGLGEWPGMPPVQVTVPPAVPDIYVDTVSIGHVLVNLVDNARRYGGAGAIGLRARRRRSVVVVTVEDEGPGIPPDERVLVFDRRYRGRTARDAHPGGTGTGLHVCRRLIEAHGGRIWIEPEAGRSAVSFSVPVARRAHVSGEGDR
jgi:signal transduction histidine kinase